MSQGQVYQEPSEVTILPLPPSQLPPSLGGVMEPPLAWLLAGDTLSTFDTRTGRKLSTWSFPGFTVTNSCQFPLSFSKCYLLLVLESSSECLVALINPQTAKLLRLVCVPHRVSSLCLVSPSNLTSQGLFAQSVLRAFSGVVALGCVGGHVFLVDLGLAAGGVASSDDELAPRDLSDARQFFLIDLSQGPATAAMNRAADEGRHAAIEITAKCYQGEGFSFYAKDGTILKTFSASSVAVTAVHFDPHIATLLVGFNFGSFQMYSLTSFTLLHSTPTTLPLPPVTHFTFLEPADDPRCFVYVWVARGGTPFIKESLRCENKLTLYQLVFARKTSGASLPSYQAFQGCGPRLEYHMTATPSLPQPRASVGTRLIRCFTIQRHRKGCGLDESHDEHTGEDLSLAAFIWQCAEQSSEGGGEGGGGGEVLAAIFDINQWYHSQMPSAVKWRPSGKRMRLFSCSFFGFFSLSPAMEDGAHILGAGVSGVTSLLSLPPTPETHSWPLALSFRLTTLSEDAIKTCTFLGVQRSALQGLLRGARLLYAEPQRLFQQCEGADLLPLPSSWDTDTINIDSQRMALLMVALEWDLVPVLMSFQEAWLTCGASDPVLVAWVKRTLAEITSNQQQLCQPLFTGHAPSEATPTLGYFHRLCVRARVVCQLLQRALTALAPSPAPSSGHKVVQELTVLSCDAAILCKMLEVHMWCVDCSLLPVSQDPYNERCFGFPAAVLTRQYARLRNHGNQLCVDYFCTELDSEGGFPYPTASLEEFLGIFATVSPLAQHCLMMYFLKDIMSLDEENDQYHQLLRSYSRAQALPAHLVAFVLGAWHLDHRKYKEAVRLLLNPHHEHISWFPWQHKVVVSALLEGGVASLACDYIVAHGSEMQGEEEVRLKLRASAFAGNLPGSLTLLRVFEGSDSYCDIVNYFLDCCYHAKTLHLVSRLPLNALEEDGLCAYLEGSASLVCQELLVGHLLSRHRYLEAKALHDKITPLVKADHDAGVRERGEQREAILSGFTPAVPSVLRGPHSFPTTAGSRPSGPRLTVDPTKPLSAIVAKQLSSGAIKSQSGLIYATLESIAQARSAAAEPLTPFSSNKDVARVTDLSHAPFLSTPLSVRKLKQRRDTPLLQPSPVHRSHPHTLTPSTTLTDDVEPPSSFLNEMKSFRMRMASFKSVSVLESSIIVTPEAQTPVLVGRGSLLRPTIATPPSILKVRRPLSQGPTTPAPPPPPPPPPSDATQSARLTEPTPRKIRFAVESSTPQESVKSKPSYVPVQPSPLTTHTPAHPSPLTIAAVTPLPLSDDSDLFLSPAESPSQLHSPPSHPSPPSQRLFATPAKAGSQSDMELGQQSEDGSESQEEYDGIATEGDGIETQHRLLDQSEEAIDAGETPRIVSMATPQPAASPLLNALPREGISSMARFRTPAHPPTPPSLFTPSSSHHQQQPPLRRPALVLSSSGSSQKQRAPSTAAAAWAGALSPNTLTELLEAKKQQLHRSLEASMKKELSSINTPAESPVKVSRVSVVKNRLSATMVSSSVTMETTPQRGAQTSSSPAFVFSQPIPSPVATETPSSNSSESVGVETKASSFVFSPPLTRSAARKRKEQVSTDVSAGRQRELETLDVSAGRQRELETLDVSAVLTPAHTAAAASTKRRGRPRKSTKTAALKSEDPVSLVTPPTTPLATGPALLPHQRSKPVRTAVGTRRSTRLISGRK